MTPGRPYSTPRDYYPTGTRYGSHAPERPYFVRLEDGITLKVPRVKDHIAADGEGTYRLSPDAVRELIVAGVMALQDEAYDEESQGFQGSATLASRYLHEIGIPKL